MHMYEIPLLFALIGLAMYAVLAGADFGAGIWQLTAGGGPSADRIRTHAHDAIGPVWEANHVWLVFVITVVWTAYPRAFGSIASTLSIPLFIAAVGIIGRGATYALRAAARSGREAIRIDTAFAFSSILTPFALGVTIGGIASGRVPVGNAAGDLVSSWLNPTSILIGVLAVAMDGYLAAVYLSADAARLREPDLARSFRRRALIAAGVAGGLAIAGLPVLRSDAPGLYDGLTGGPGLPALVVSIAAGVAAVALVWRSRFELARYAAALAVAAIIAGWALAQEPMFLPGLTVEQAAAPYDTLVLLVVSVIAGGMIVFPSLALLFRLLLRGAFDPGAPIEADPPAPAALLVASSAGLRTRAAAACLLAGFALLTIAEASWAHIVGAALLLAFIALAFVATAPDEVAKHDPA